METKRQGSEASGPEIKRTKAENGESSKPSPAPKKEAVPVPDLEECGFVAENLPQVCLLTFS
jgi:hypothetical protein